MSQSYQKSFLTLLSFVFLVPIFFIPGSSFSLASAKPLFFLFGIALSALVFSFEFWKQGALKMPKHFFMLIAAVLPALYALSAFLSTPRSLALFGYGFEVGTFSFMLIGFVFFFLATLIFSDSSRALQALTAFFISFSLIAVLSAVKILAGGDFLALGNFFGKTGNPLGNWTDLAMAFGLLALFSTLAIGIIPMKASVKGILYAVFFLSAGLLAMLNFKAALVLTLIGAVVALAYFLKFENHFLHAPEAEKKAGFWSKPILLPIVLLIITLLFAVNLPIGSEGKYLNSVVAQKFGVENTDVRPSVSATFNISKAALSQDGLLGSGPNTFGQDWLAYKPINVNSTPFWGLTFNFGVGFIPTQVASIGIAGSLLWLAFFIALLSLAVKALGCIPESRPLRFVIVSSLASSLFLWAAAFIYNPSGAMLLMAFFFTGLFVASLSEASIIPHKRIEWGSTSRGRTSRGAVVAVLTIGAVALGFSGVNKARAAYHWERANDLISASGASVPSIEDEVIKAIKASPTDAYYVALSKLNFLKAQAAANSTSTPQEAREKFDAALSQSIDSAKLAVALNPAGYANWVMLGSIYSTLTAQPLALEGAYENAKFAYSEALKRNPGNPELYLLLAKLEVNKGDAEAARTYLKNAITLKENYADAYLMLAQLEIAEGNAPGAIASTQKLVALVPNNPGLYFELGVLKYASRDYAGAEKELAQALSIVPEYANAKYYRGLALAALGRKDEARAYFEELLAANPGNAEVQSALDSLDGNKKKSRK